MIKTCPECNGSGVADQGTDDERQCPTCGGVGYVNDGGDDDGSVLNTLDVMNKCRPMKRLWIEQTVTRQHQTTNLGKGRPSIVEPIPLGTSAA